MIKIDLLMRRPIVFRRLTGITIEKFNSLLKLFDREWEKHEKKNKNRKNRIRKIGGGRNYDLNNKEKLLLALMYYRLYTSQEFLGFLFDMHQSNVSRNIAMINPILSRIFRIPENRISIDEDEILELIYDATEQEVYKPKKKQKEYYSGKKKKHTIKHQIVISKEGKIKAVSKSFGGKTHDKKIYDKSKIKMTIRVPRKGDLGYIGTSLEMPFKKPKKGKLTDVQKDFNRAFSSERVKVEHVFGKMKIFKILAHEFRNPKKSHRLIFKNIAGLYNMMYAN